MTPPAANKPNANTIHKAPKLPKISNIPLHPVFSIINGATDKPKIDPTLNPLKVNATARDRSPTGIALAMISVTADGTTPSPKPTKTLAKNNAGKLSPAKGIANVANEINVKPNGRTLAPPNFVFKNPPGICDSAKP